MMASRKARILETRAFTLIELLVVIGIIAVLAGTIGLALKGNNPDAAVRSGQGLALSAISAARGQAALNQVDACIAVQADSSQDDFLRRIWIVTKTSSTATTWKQVGSEILLPEGVYVVPPGSVTGVTMSGTWGGKNSTFFEAPNPAVVGAVAVALNTAPSSLLISKTVSALGTTDGGRIVIAPGRKTGPDSLVIDNPSAVRGMVVSRYGIASLVNEADSFRP